MASQALPARPRCGCRALQRQGSRRASGGRQESGGSPGFFLPARGRQAGRESCDLEMLLKAAGQRYLDPRICRRCCAMLRRL